MSLRLGEILLEKGLITPAQLEAAVKKQQESKEYLGNILVESGQIAEKELLYVLAEQQNIPFVDFRDVSVADDVVARVPAKFARHYKIMPLKMQDDTLTVAIANPFDVWPLDDLATNLGYRIEKVLATTADIEDAIRQYYGVAAETIERIMAEERRVEPLAEFRPAGRVEDLEKMAESASVVQVVNQILHQAIGERATDVHLEVFRDDARLRYRVDGILRDAHVSGDIKYLYPAIISRIKIMSGLDIIERRLPQDGRAKVSIGALEYDLRVSVMPSIYGENVVIRVLPTQMMFSMQDLGLVKQDRDVLDRLLTNTNGIIFVTGPTGSGKSTTLYAALKLLNGAERKLVTIEDPVEYELKGVTQVQIYPKIGLSFASTLRSMLRHDPDVIMVGEIRDLETANISIRAALTGHLVLSTMHTNDAASAVTRLLDIGIEPYLVASAVRAFIAQRLVRRICQNCRREVTVDDETLRRFGHAGEKVTAWEGSGCDACGGSGYRGRTAIYEIITVDDAIRDLINQKASAEKVRHQAVQKGVRLLKDDGFEKIAAGITTPQEVLRVTQLEE
jgi:type IV pilus assembly protein PilB